MFKAMRRIDIAEFDHLEKCFEINIDVFESDDAGEDISKIVHRVVSSVQLAIFLSTCVMLFM